MTDLVRQTVARYEMLQSGDCVVVALSGGADSVALLHCLISIKEKYNLTIAAAHLNHLLRGEEAERDEQFCKILCEKYNIPLYMRRCDIRTLAQQRKISEELCGRQERYAFFDTLAQRHGAKIATAHTASDNAETLLFNLTRGASLAGAGGIPPVRLPYIRPLIACTRAQIEDYCRCHDLAFVTDSTNLSDAYSRNQIRHRVIPALRELNPRFEEAALRFCESARQISAHLDSQADDLLTAAETSYGWQAAVLLQADAAVCSCALARLCEDKAGFSPESRHLALLEDALRNGGAVDLGDARAVCRQGLLRFAAKSAKNDEKNHLEIPLCCEISFSHRDTIVTARVDNSNSELKDLVFRYRNSGDRFTFAKRNLTKPLRKALHEAKVPAERRDSVLLLCRGSEVLWCEALGWSREGETLKNSGGLSVSVN